MIKIIFSFFLYTILSISFAQESIQPLPADQAFQFASSIDNTNTLNLQWTIAPTYYLYRDRVSIEFTSNDNAKLGEVVLPPGHEKQDKIRGKYQAYTDNLSVTIPLIGNTKTGVLEVSYQGCSSQGFCYPPIKQTLQVDLQNHTINSGEIDTPPEKINDQGYATQLLVGKHYFAIILGFLGLGLLLAFTPCVLPMIPIISGIIVGYGKKISTGKAFTLALSYVLGMAIAYALAGMLVASAGSSIQTALQKPWVISVFSGVFVLLSLSLFGLYEVTLPSKWHHWMITHSNRQKSGTYVGVFFMGAISTLIVSPCVTAPLVGVLAYIGNTGDVVLGGTALLALGIGMGIPLLIIGASAGKLLPKTGAWMNVIKQLFGVMMLGLAIWMMARILSPTVILFLWSLLAIIAAVLFWRYRAAHPHWHKVNRGLGISFLTYGFILIVGSLLGNSDPFAPLSGVTISHQASQSLHFVTIQSMQQLDAELRQAKQNNQKVMLDFYADWCVSCVAMDKNVFTQTEVKGALQNYILLRADVTQNNMFDKSLLKRFQVVAPPTILLFRPGEDLPSKNIIGEVNTADFLANLERNKTNLCAPNVQSC